MAVSEYEQAVIAALDLGQWDENGAKQLSELAARLQLSEKEVAESHGNAEAWFWDHRANRFKHWELASQRAKLKTFLGMPVDPRSQVTSARKPQMSGPNSVQGNPQKVAIIICVAIALGLFIALGKPFSPSSDEIRAKVSLGMSSSEVKHYIGEPSSIQSLDVPDMKNLKVSNGRTEMLYWEIRDGQFMQLVFEEDKLSSINRW